MLKGVRERLKRNYAVARARENRLLLSYDIARVNRIMMILLFLFIGLNFFDAATTLIAMRAGPAFVELNPIASHFFSLDFPGFVLALALKYLPIAPLAYATLIRNPRGHPIGFRVVKISALIALFGANIIYAAVVASNSAALINFYLN
jgi:Domain of unknown function (DUF5658)